VFNEHDLSAARGFVAPGFVNRNARPGTPAGPEGARQVFSRLWAGCETGLITEHLAVSRRRHRFPAARRAARGHGPY
jgi:hypothetical protein